MSGIDDSDPLITAGQVAAMAGVTTTTVGRWVIDGILTPALYTLGGHARFRLSEVKAILAATGRRDRAS